MRSVLSVHWKDWCWSWISNTLATQCKELTHWNRPWCWARLKVQEGDDRGWDGSMASLTWWMWVWASFRSLWWTGKPSMQSMGSQRVRHNWVTELKYAGDGGREDPLSKKWQPTPEFLPGKFHGQRILSGLHSMRPQRVRCDWTTECARACTCTCTHTHTHTHTHTYRYTPINFMS